MKRFENILKKEVTRREFLIHVGLLLLLISGISGIATKLHQFPKLNPIDDSKPKFGNGPYGGMSA